MKRLVYIIILSLTTVLIITAIDLFFSKDDTQQEKPVLEDFAVDWDSETRDTPTEETDRKSVV